MAADTKEFGVWVCREQQSRSNLVKVNEIVYKMDNSYMEGKMELLVAYKPLGTNHPVRLTLSLDDLGIKALAEDAETSDETLSDALQCALRIYVVNLEKKAWAIALLEKYKTERVGIASEYKVSACLLGFFKDPLLQPLQGIPKKDKLAAVDKILKYLDDSKTQVSPNLELSETDIKALTNGKLGDRIEEIAAADKEFSAAFKLAKNKLVSSSPQPS